MNPLVPEQTQSSQKKPQQFIKRWDLALLYLPAIALFIWTHGIEGFNGYYGQDSHAYLAYCRKIVAFFHSGSLPGDFFWPVNYPMAGALIALVPAIGKVSLPLVSLAAFLGLLRVFRGVLVQWLGAAPCSASIFTLCSLGLSPVLLRASNLAMSDMLAMFLTFAGWHQAHRFFKQGSGRAFLTASVLAGLAIGTRYPSAVLLTIPGALTILGIARHRQWRLLLPSLFLFLSGLFPTWLLTGAFPGVGDYAASHHFSVVHWFQSEFPNHIDGHLRYSRINLAYIAEILYRPDYIWPILPAVLFLGPREFKRLEVKSALATCIGYLLIIAGLDMQNPRFLLPALPFLVLPLFPAWQRVFASIPKFGFKVIFMLAVAAFSVAIFLRLMAPMQQRQALESRIAASIRSLPKETIYTFAMDSAIAAYDVKQAIVNLWQAPIDTFQVNGYVLFNQARFAHQWRGRLPMTNWEHLQDTHHLILVNDYGEGWQLFKIGPLKTPHD